MLMKRGVNMKDNYLSHVNKGYQRPNHKYIERYWMNGKWHYRYKTRYPERSKPTNMKERINDFIDYNITGEGYESDLKKANDNYYQTVLDEYRYDNNKGANTQREIDRLYKDHTKYVDSHRNKSVKKFVKDIPNKIGDAYDDARWSATDNARDFIRNGRKKVSNILRKVGAKSINVAEKVDYKEPKEITWTRN